MMNYHFILQSKFLDYEQAGNVYLLNAVNVFLKKNCYLSWTVYIL